MRLFCFRAEEVRGEEAVRRRVSSSMRNSRWLEVNACDGMRGGGAEREDRGVYFIEEDLDLGFGIRFFFCGFWGDVGGGGKAGIGVEEGVCLARR